MNARVFVLVIAAVSLLVSCGIPASNVRGAPLPTLSIVSPANNAIIGNGTPVAVVFAVTNFNLTDPGSGTSSPNVGHVDVFVDGARIQGVSVNTIALPLRSGPHGIRLQLVTDNGSALNPDVAASVVVTVTQGPAGGRPGISIPFPQNGTRIGTDLTVAFRITNFSLVPGGPAGVPNEGHIRAILDNASYAELTQYAPLHLNLGNGDHTLTLQLVDSANTSLNPDVAATVHFTVQALIGRVIPFDATLYLAGANILLGLAILAAIYRKLEVQ